MSNYVKTVNFAAKDALLTGDSNKLIKGTEIGTEYDNIATASATKANKISGGANNNLVSQDAGGDIKNSTIITDGAGTITADLVGDVTGNADTVTTNANLTGPVTSVGNTTSIGTGVITATHLAADSVDTSEIVSDAVGTAEIASGAVRFNNEIALGTDTGNWSMTNGSTQAIPRGVYNFYLSIDGGNVTLQLNINAGWRSSLVLTTAGDALQVVSDGSDVRLLSAGSNTVHYQELFT